MTGYLIGAGLVAWLTCIIGLVYAFAESNQWRYLVALVVVLALGLGFAVQHDMDQRNAGPCLRSEVQTHWDPALKIMRPANVCIERGEWVQ